MESGEAEAEAEAELRLRRIPSQPQLAMPVRGLVHSNVRVREGKTSGRVAGSCGCDSWWPRQVWVLPCLHTSSSTNTERELGGSRVQSVRSIESLDIELRLVMGGAEPSTTLHWAADTDSGGGGGGGGGGGFGEWPAERRHGISTSHSHEMRNATKAFLQVGRGVRCRLGGARWGGVTAERRGWHRRRCRRARRPSPPASSRALRRVASHRAPRCAQTSRPAGGCGSGSRGGTSWPLPSHLTQPLSPVCRWALTSLSPSHPCVGGLSAARGTSRSAAT